MKKYLVIFLLAISACTPKELRQELRILDAELEKREEYVADFERNNDILRTLLSESREDSLKCVYASRLYDAYRHFNLDSCAKYNAIETSFAVCESQRRRAQFHSIYEMFFRGAQEEASLWYHSIDTEGFSREETIEYLGLGIDLFKNDNTAKDTLNILRERLMAIDTVSFLGRKNLAMIYRSKGEYDRSLSILEDCLNEFSDSRDIASIYYNMARLYGLKGQGTMCEIWLTRTAVLDIECANKDYQSLYMLALQRLDNQDFKRAVRYINAHYSDVSSAYLYPRIIISGVAEQRISQEYLKVLKSNRWMMLSGLIALTVLVAIVLILLGKNKRKNQALQKISDELRGTNNALALSNKIKEGYVFRYMMLALSYMDEVQENRKEYRRILKDKGSDELYRVLKQVDKAYNSEKEFYKVFDDTFIGIFPSFVSEVNKLLPESARFDESAHSLPTEIRILAVIRLGITSSPDISNFLKCSLPTVYTYRAKLRNLALCKKEEFEQKVSHIGL